MSTKTAKQIHIFRAGRHTAMSGESIQFTEQDLAASAAAYDPALHEAPLVVGHPRTDAPAYGWVKALHYGEARGMEADADDIDPAFAELVQARRFGKVSASWYRPDSPSNPVPGVYYLRHVGFLGAQPPAVKGLRSPEFAEDEEGVIEFADMEDMISARLWRGLRDWMIEKFGGDVADKVLPGDAITWLEQDAATDDSEPDDSTGATYQEPEDPKTMTTNANSKPNDQAAREEQARKAAEFAEREQNIADREQAIAERERKARRSEVAEFVEAQITAGHVLPRERDGMIEFMGALNDDNAIEFGEGEAKTSIKPGAWFREFVARLPQAVDYSERSAREEGDSARGGHYQTPHGYDVDPARLALHEKALAYMEQHEGVDYTDAVIKVGG